MARAVEHHPAIPEPRLVFHRGTSHPSVCRQLPDGLQSVEETLRRAGDDGDFVRRNVERVALLLGYGEIFYPYHQQVNGVFDSRFSGFERTESVQLHGLGHIVAQLLGLFAREIGVDVRVFAEHEKARRATDAVGLGNDGLCVQSQRKDQHDR